MSKSPASPRRLPFCVLHCRREAGSYSDRTDQVNTLWARFLQNRHHLGNSSRKPQTIPTYGWLDPQPRREAGRRHPESGRNRRSDFPERREGSSLLSCSRGKLAAIRRRRKSSRRQGRASRPSIKSSRPQRRSFRREGRTSRRQGRTFAGRGDPSAGRGEPLAARGDPSAGRGDLPPRGASLPPAGARRPPLPAGRREKPANLVAARVYGNRRRRLSTFASKELDLISLDGCMIPLPCGGKVSPDGAGRLFEN